MRCRTFPLALLVLSFGSVAASRADVMPHSLFSENMVLQRGMKVQFWFVDEDKRRLLDRRVRKNHEKLCDARSQFREHVTFIVDEELERFIVIGRSHFESIVPEDVSDRVGQPARCAPVSPASSPIRPCWWSPPTGFPCWRRSSWRSR